LHICGSLVIPALDADHYRMTTDHTLDTDIYLALGFRKVLLTVRQHWGHDGLAPTALMQAKASLLLGFLHSLSL
jgi:hypothetical protein